MARMIRCEYCGKEYAWRPEMEGRKVRCKCGHRIEVAPETPAPQPSARQEDIYALADDVQSPAARQADQPVQSLGDIAQRKCPACDAALEASDLLCLNCGMNLKTGHRPSARPINTPAGPTSQASDSSGANEGKWTLPHPTIPRPVERADINPNARKAGLLATASIVLVLAVIVGLFLLLHKPSPPVVYMGDDQRIISELEDGSTTVADFLEQGNNHTMFSGMNASQARAFDLKLRGLGAVEVSIARTLNGMMVRELIIRLPADASRRKALFDFQVEYYATTGRKVDVDVGQKYMRIILNL